MSNLFVDRMPIPGVPTAQSIRFPWDVGLDAVSFIMLSISVGMPMIILCLITAAKRLYRPGKIMKVINCE